MDYEKDFHKLYVYPYIFVDLNKTNDVDRAVSVDTVAHSLSMQCRFAGHVPYFYSVAEHSNRCFDFLWYIYAVKYYLSDVSYEDVEFQVLKEHSVNVKNWLNMGLSVPRILESGNLFSFRVVPYEKLLSVVSVDRFTTEELRNLFAALTHDMAESLTSDVPTPTKNKVPEYKTYEGRVERLFFKALENKYELGYNLLDYMGSDGDYKFADTFMAFWEMHTFFNWNDFKFDELNHMGRWKPIEFHSPELAKTYFGASFDFMLQRLK